MKGIIFTSFIDLVEEKFGMEITDEILSEVETKTNGSYTNVGTYDHQELVNMVVKLSDKTDIPIPDLLKTFGFTLFSKLMSSHAKMVADVKTPFEMFELIDPFIHKEVKKLYPEAETPKFSTTKLSDSEMVLTYSSVRKMGDVAEGLILGCLAYFSVKGKVVQKVLEKDDSIVEFKITLLNDE